MRFQTRYIGQFPFRMKEFRVVAASRLSRKSGSAGAGNIEIYDTVIWMSLILRDTSQESYVRIL